MAVYGSLLDPNKPRKPLYEAPKRKPEDAPKR